MDKEKVIEILEYYKEIDGEIAYFRGCYSAFYLMPKTGVFRRINWRVKHTHLICRLTMLHSPPYLEVKAFSRFREALTSKYGGEYHQITAKTTLI